MQDSNYSKDLLKDSFIVVNNFINNVDGALEYTESYVKAFMENVGENADGALEYTGNSVKTFMENVGENTGSAFEYTGNSAKTFMENVGENADSALEYTENSVKTFMGNVGENADGALKYTKDWGFNFSENLKNVPESLELLLKNSGENIVKPVQKLIYEELQEMQNDWYSAIEYATEIFVFMTIDDESEKDHPPKYNPDELAQAAEELTTDIDSTEEYEPEFTEWDIVQ